MSHISTRKLKYPVPTKHSCIVSGIRDTKDSENNKKLSFLRRITFHVSVAPRVLLTREMANRGFVLCTLALVAFLQVSRDVSSNLICSINFNYYFINIRNTVQKRLYLNSNKGLLIKVYVHWNK